jgi:putative sigma-54 modulation protein
MRTDIRFIDCRPSETLRAHVEKKIEKLESEFGWVVNGKICFRRNKSDKKKNKLAEIELKVPGNVIYAEACAEKFLAACDESFAKIHRQLEKLKTSKGALRTKSRSPIAE